MGNLQTNIHSTCWTNNALQQEWGRRGRKWEELECGMKNKVFNWGSTGRKKKGEPSKTRSTMMMEQRVDVRRSARDREKLKLNSQINQNLLKYYTDVDTGYVKSKEVWGKIIKSHCSNLARRLSYKTLIILWIIVFRFRLFLNRAILKNRINIDAVPYIGAYKLT